MQLMPTTAAQLGVRNVFDARQRRRHARRARLGSGGSYALSLRGGRWSCHLLESSDRAALVNDPRDARRWQIAVMHPVHSPLLRRS
jgi:hypothetical protein